MNKFELLDLLLNKNNGFIRTAAATSAGVSKAYFMEYVKNRGLERVGHGLYKSQDTWDVDMYVIQVRYPEAVFSHETSLLIFFRVFG